MERIDAERFLELYSNKYGQPKPKRAEGLIFLLNSMSDDEAIIDLRWAAYMLATTRHETAKTFQPIAEYGKGSGRKYGIPDKVTGKIYYGRGYVQLTWKENYAAMGRVFEMDFVNNPDLVMEPDIAYKIMSYGMRKGSFTGVRLSMYICGEKCDYKAARRIINGMDCAEMIAEHAESMEEMLRKSV